MGFHYTKQYSRRTRINVMGLVDHSSEEWARWYDKAHEEASLKKIAAAGYGLMEIHFLYGFGLNGEKEEIELTRKMVSNAHKYGIKVLGYFQFFSVQEELFFIENPWASECMQLKSNGERHEYSYDRPALCFSHKKVQEYYLKGVEKGLKYCGLDGIRLDNDYYRGCYCETCQEEFRKYLKKEFSSETAKRVFGFSDLRNVSLVPSLPGDAGRGSDPLWMATCKFRQYQRQKIMRLISDKVLSLKADAILGGNPAISRKPTDIFHSNFYPPDLGETHHLICAENAFFPGRTGNSFRHQITAYKHGQSNDFKVFASHHLYNPDASLRWPESFEECALSFGEALCFGGHVPCATWGLRMDASERKTLYERPHFMKAASSVSDFLKSHGNIYKSAKCAADVGIYMNRESFIGDNSNAWHSVQGTIQILLAAHTPFKFVDRDDPSMLAGLKLLIIPDMKAIGNFMLKEFTKFMKAGSSIIATGKSAMSDEYFLLRDADEYGKFIKSENFSLLSGTPEKANSDDVEYIHEHCCINIPMPGKGTAFLDAVKKVYTPIFDFKGGRFVAADFFSNNKKEYFLHLLNYDNKKAVSFSITANKKIRSVEFYYPDAVGPSREPAVEINEKRATVKIAGLHTYMVMKFKY